MRVHTGKFGHILSLNQLRRPALAGVWQRLQPALAARLPRWISIILISAIAWTLAELTWESVPKPRLAVPIYSAEAPASGPGSAAASLADLHLFGTASARSTTNAPETTLALTLSGIVAATPGGRDSRAIIASDGNQQTYAIGAAVPGGAVIRAIYPDRVLLELNGSPQILRLPKASGEAATTSVQPTAPYNPPPAPVYGRPFAPTTSLGQLRQELVMHPERLLDVVRAMPVMANGKLAGYRVFPVGNNKVFARLGLQPGDVVTAVNGLPLDNPAESMRVLNSVKTSDQITITLTRNGQQQTQVVQLPAHGG